MPEEDAILPDDFVATPPAEEPQAPVTPTEPKEETPPATETTPAAATAPTEPVAPDPQKLKIKFNHEEMELSHEEAAVLAQKGLNYDKAVERAKQDSRDAFIAEKGFTWQGKPITTEADYNQAMAEKDLLDKYQGQIPDEIMKEIVAGRNDRVERAKEKAAADEKAKRDAEDLDFLEYFRDANGRIFDPAADKLHADVVKAHQGGKSLRTAYMEHHVKELKTQLQISKQNEENLKKAPVGSVTAHGGTEVGGKDDFERGFDSVD